MSNYATETHLGLSIYFVRLNAENIMALLSEAKRNAWMTDYQHPEIDQAIERAREIIRLLK